MAEAPAGALSKSQQAYRWIKTRIVSRDFTPGYRLVLGAIAADLHMSQVPVREAVRQLEAEGLVTHIRNIGAHVAMVDDSQYRHTMETLGMLEAAATALAAPRLDAHTLRAAREINRTLRAHLVAFDPAGFTALNHRFHATLFDPCPNPRLTHLVEAEWTRLSHLRQSTFTFIPGRARHSVDEHDQILDLIERGAPAADIEQAARRHRSATLHAYLAHQHPSDTVPNDDAPPHDDAPPEP